MGQPSHWTYCPYSPTDDLQQGDIIRRDPVLLELLSDFLSHFCDDRYTGFLVVTQSCDLVRRKEQVCKAEYINLCVIRELQPLLQTLLEPCCGVGIPGVFDSERRLHAEQFLKRIINQNEQARGLFYLHPDADAGIATPSVALLRVSIALRREHYDLLRGCRCGRVGPEFSAKLGWLAGNLFSRVATPDWEDKAKDEQASTKQVRALMQRVSQPNDENWVPAKWMRFAREKKTDLSNIPLVRFRSALSEFAPPELLNVILDAVQRLGRAVIVDGPAAIVGGELAEDTQFIGEVVGQIKARIGNLLSENQKELLAGSLIGDKAFCKAMADQAANLLKRNAAAVGGCLPDKLAKALETATGILVPAKNRLQQLLSELAGSGIDGVSQVLSTVDEGCPFNKSASEIAVGKMQDVLGNTHFEDLERIVSRLRNDPTLRAACREHVVNSLQSSESLD